MTRMVARSSDILKCDWQNTAQEIMTDLFLHNVNGTWQNILGSRQVHLLGNETLFSWEWKNIFMGSLRMRWSKLKEDKIVESCIFVVSHKSSFYYLPKCKNISDVEHSSNIETRFTWQKSLLLVWCQHSWSFKQRKILEEIQQAKVATSLQGDTWGVSRTFQGKCDFGQVYRLKNYCWTREAILVYIKVNFIEGDEASWS